MPTFKRAGKIQSHVYVRRGHPAYVRLMKFRVTLERIAGCPLSWAQVIEALMNKAKV